jgi:hypothetical protein
MLLLDPPTQTIDETVPEIYLYEHSTVICGKIIEVDYLSRVEDKMVIESFYGDIDLFGF